MPNYNKVIIMGHMTRDPEMATTKSGTVVAHFGLAVNRKSGKGDDAREEVVFVDVTAWSATAEIIHRYVHKGDAIHIEGRLSLDTWEDKNGGGKRSKLYVTADSIQLLGGKREGQDDARGGQQATPKAVQTKFNPAVNDGIPF